MTSLQKQSDSSEIVETLHMGPTTNRILQDVKVNYKKHKCNISVHPYLHLNSIGWY